MPRVRTGALLSVCLRRELSGKDEFGIMAVKSGRPRLDNRPGFLLDLRQVSACLNAGEISQREAAQELYISPRSLMRYLASTELCPGQDLMLE